MKITEMDKANNAKQVLVCDEKNYNYRTLLHYMNKGIEPPSKTNQVPFEPIFTEDGIPVAYHYKMDGQKLMTVQEWEKLNEQDTKSKDNVSLV